MPGTDFFLISQHEIKHLIKQSIIGNDTPCTMLFFFSAAKVYRIKGQASP